MFIGSSKDALAKACTVGGILLEAYSKKRIQEKYAKDMGLKGRYDVKVSFDSAHKSDYYMFYMYYTKSEQWKMRLIKYPGDAIEIVNVKNLKNGARWDVYNTEYDAKPEIVDELNTYLKKAKMAVYNIKVGDIYGVPSIYPSPSGNRSM